jgi:hypothetical protein
LTILLATRGRKNQVFWLQAICRKRKYGLARV